MRINLTSNPIENRSGSGRQVIGFMSAHEVVAARPEWSLDRNARRPDIDRHPPSRDIRRTLAERPESFVDRNGGLILLVQQGRVRGDQVVVEGGRPELIDGAHTVENLVRAANEGEVDLERVRVRVSILIGHSYEEAVEIAIGQNTRRGVKKLSLKNLRGDFDELKDLIPTRCRIESCENEKRGADYTIQHVIQHLALVSNPTREPRAFTRIYSGGGALMSKFRSDQYRHAFPVLVDVIGPGGLVDRVWGRFGERVGLNRGGRNPLAIPFTRHEKSESKLQPAISGISHPYRVPNAIAFMVVAAFRRFLREERGQLTWVEPIEQLWDRYGDDFLTAAWQSYESWRGPNPLKTGAWDAFGKDVSAWMDMERRVTEVLATSPARAA